MELWEEHGFAPTGPLANNATHVDVYDEDDADNSKWKARMQQLKPPHYPPLDRRAQAWELEHEKQRQVMRGSPKYQFIMMVAGMADLRLNQLWVTPGEDPGKASASEGTTRLGGLTTDPLAAQHEFQHRWTSSPLVSGALYLSPKMFAGIREAENILASKTRAPADLDALMTDARKSPLFARLVAIRINVSGYFSGNRYFRDRDYQRLYRDQTFVLRELARLCNTRRARSPPPINAPLPRTSLPRRFNTATGTYA